MANTPTKDYSVDIEKLFLEMMLDNVTSYTRVLNIFNPQNFDRSLRETASFIQTHVEKFKVMPTREQIRATCNVDLAPTNDLQEDHYEWFMVEFESFTRRRELERAILKSADMIEKGDYGPVEKLVKDAVQISLTRDLGLDYWLDPKSRIEKYFTSGGQQSTGWPQLDHLLYGGFDRKTLNIFAGGSGSGKSLVMMNLAVNWLSMGLNGAYISLELSEELCALRTDAMMTALSTKDIRKDIDTTSAKVKVLSKKYGSYAIKGMPAQSTTNDIRSYLKELQIKTGIKLDFVMFDYLDLIMPVSVKVNPSDQFIKDKYVSEELRNLSIEFNVLCVTASQLNRNSVDETEFDHSHIAGGISKINSADNVFAIFTSRAMKERGKYQLQCLKSRNSTGTNQKIDLDYDINTMRITDPGLEATSQVNGSAGSSILSNIKSSTVVTPENAPKINADVGSSKLKALLNNLKTSD